MVQTEGELKRISIVDQILERVRTDILGGKYLPNGLLPPERDLAQTYGVNRNSVRQALVKLEESRLIIIKQGIGSIVRDYRESGGLDLIEHLLVKEGAIDLDMVKEILEARRLAGSMIASLAARERSDEEMSQLESILDELKDAQLKSESATKIQILESNFFQHLGKASHNRVFAFMANSLVSTYRRYMSLFSHAFRDANWIIAHFEKITEAVKRRDTMKAQRETERYFFHNEKRLLGLGRKSNGRGKPASLRTSN